MKILGYIGNIPHLQLHKTAFLCSRLIPASAVLKCYDWAIAMREENKCVISGFHSQIEKDVLHYLLKGTQPIIVVLARGLKQKIEKEFITALEQGRLLIITPFENSITRVSKKNAIIRNQFMAMLANDLVLGYKKDGGELDALLKIDIVAQKLKIILS